MSTSIEITTIELKIKHIRKAIIANKEAHGKLIRNSLIMSGSTTAEMVKILDGYEDIEDFELFKNELIKNGDTENLVKYNATYQKLIDYQNELLENNFTFKALNDYLSKEDSLHKWLNADNTTFWR